MPKLLIVDDEETIRAGLASMIGRLLPQWEIAGLCEDAEQAWESIRACAPDLAIIDIAMAGMSGLELARRLQEERPEIGKIMLTGYDKFSYVQEALRAGAADYLLKPVQRDELVAACGKVEAALAERARREPRELRLPDREEQERLYREIASEQEEAAPADAERAAKLNVALELNDMPAVVRLLEMWHAELGIRPEEEPLLAFSRLFRFVAYFAGLQSSRVYPSMPAELHTEIAWLSGRLLLAGEPEALLADIGAFIGRVSGIKTEPSDARKLIGKVKESIRREFGNPDFSLEQAAQHVHLNPTYLSELFKETTGQKFIDYLTDVRLDEARRMLTETDMKMYEVCLAVGYTSSKYFSTLFRKKFAVTPTMYREGQSGRS